MYSIDEIIRMHGQQIAALGYGRRQLATWLNDNLEGKYTEHFARRVLQEMEDDPELKQGPKMSGKSMEELLRETYELNDPTWIPVSVWGDPRAPRAKWERRLDLIDSERIQKLHAELAQRPLRTDTQASGERMAVLSIRDVHFGMFTDHPGPYETYDLNEAQTHYERAASKLINEAVSQGAETLVFPVGSDMINVDGPSNTTTKGTPQDVSTSWNKAFRAALESVNNVINEAVNTNGIKKVIVVAEPGNHDNTLAQTLGMAIESKWDGNGVQVLAGDETLKMVNLGSTYLFFSHGDGAKPESYAGIIYADHPQCATRGNYVEVLTGHLHHRRKSVLKAPGDYLEESSIVHRITPALCPSSNWSEFMGYRSQPGAQLTIYDSKGFLSLFEYRP